MHDDMPSGPIQGQGQVRGIEIRNFSIFKIYSLRHFQWKLPSAGGGSEGSGPTPAPAHGRFYTLLCIK